MRNFRPAFIDGTTNVRTTTFKEHAATDMHARAMVLFKKQRLYYNRQHTCLGEDTLDQLLRINVEGPPLADWDATHALELWWREKTRRVNHKDSRSAPSRPQEEEMETEHEMFSLDDWEEWIADEI